MFRDKVPRFLRKFLDESKFVRKSVGKFLWMSQFYVKKFLSWGRLIFRLVFSLFFFFPILAGFRELPLLHLWNSNLRKLRVKQPNWVFETRIQLKMCIPDLDRYESYQSSLCRDLYSPPPTSLDPPIRKYPQARRNYPRKPPQNILVCSRGV